MVFFQIRVNSTPVEYCSSMSLFFAVFYYSHKYINGNSNPDLCFDCVFGGSEKPFDTHIYCLIDLKN